MAGILDTLIGREGIEKQRKFADQATKERFDTGYLNAPMNLARERAVEGIDEDVFRDDILNSVYGDETEDLERFGVSGASALAVKSDMEEQRSKVLGDAESKLQLQDEQAKRSGEEQLTNLVSQREKIMQEREAKLKENRMLAEAEAGRRKSALTGQLFNLGASFLGTSAGSEMLSDGFDSITGGISDLIGGMTEDNAITNTMDNIMDSYVGSYD